MRIEKITARDTLEIRHKVLWPNESVEFCIVDGDEGDGANHFGIFLNDDLVGVASTFDSRGAVRLRKFAVLPQHQGKGFGSALFKHAFSQAKENGASLFWCDARENARKFYEQFGLNAEGARFYKSDIPYLKMSAPL